MIRLLLFCAGILSARSAFAQQTLWTVDATATRVWFDAHATLGSFTGQNTSVSGAVDGDTSNVAHMRGRFQVRVSGFHTGNALRNKHLRDEMEVGKHPEIVIQVDSLTPQVTGAAVMHVHMQIKDAIRPLDVPVSYSIANDSIHATGQVPIRFTQFGMQPPTRLFGRAKVDDALLLHFDVLLTRSAH